MKNDGHTTIMFNALNCNSKNEMEMEQNENAQSAAICSMNEQERRLLFVSILTANVEGGRLNPTAGQAA